MKHKADRVELLARKLRSVLARLSRAAGKNNVYAQMVVGELKSIVAKLEGGEVPRFREREQSVFSVSYLLSDTSLGYTPLGDKIMCLMEEYLHLEASCNKNREDLPD